MAELTLTTFVSLDGVVQAPGGPEEDRSGGFEHGGWVIPYFDAELGAKIDEIFNKVDAFLFGRTTYDIFAGYWPKISDPEDRIAGALNSLPKFVASRTRSTFDWTRSAHIRDVVAEVPALKQRFSREVQVHGSGNLAQTLIEHDLIDEYRLLTFPVVLGRGKRLFSDGAVPAALRLVNASTSPTGVIISTYRRAGSLKTGTVQAPGADGSAT